MELDELRTAWQQLNERVETNEIMARGLWKEKRLDRTQSLLSRVRGWLTYELVSGIIMTLLTGNGIVHVPPTAPFLIPAIALHLFALVTISVSVRHIVTLSQLNYAAPVLEIQQRLARLHAARLRFHRRVFLIAPLLWPPLAIVAAKALLGLNLYIAFGPLWIVTNILFGLAFIPLMLFISHRYADRISRSGLVKTLVDDIAGRNIAKAQEVLEEIAAFERS
jgi:hypothetical protein